MLPARCMSTGKSEEGGAYEPPIRALHKHDVDDRKTLRIDRMKLTSDVQIQAPIRLTSI